MAQTHKIAYGETLSGIGAKYGISYQELAKRNNIADPNKIQAGATITVGGWEDAAPAPVQAPTQPQQVGPFLNQAQQQKFEEENKLQNANEMTEVVDAKAKADSALNELENIGPAPTAPKLQDTYNELREQYGVDVIEKDLAALKDYERQVQARRRLRTGQERDQRVGMGVISGRVNEIEQQENEEIDFVNRQIQTKVEQVNSAYQVIDLMVKFGQMDFDNAMTSYNTMLNKTLKTYELFNEKFQDTRDFNQRLIEKKQEHAMANVQIYMDMIRNGNIFYDKMSTEEKTNLAKLEVQSGLGIGFIQKMNMDPDKQKQIIGKRVDPGNGNEYVQYMVTDRNGNRKIEDMFLGQSADWVAQQQSMQLRSAEIAASTARSVASAQASVKEAQNKSMQMFNTDVDKFQSQVRDNPNSWGQAFNTLQSRYGLSNEDTDRALGVPESWIKSGKPGWEWFNSQQ